MAARSIDVAGANANTPLSPVLSPRSMSDGESINTDEELDLFEFLLETNAPTTEVSLSRLQAATVDPKTKDSEVQAPVAIPTNATFEQLGPVLYASSQALVTFLGLLPQLNTKNMYKMRVYPESFRARELLGILVRHRIAPSREEAVVVAQKLVDEHLIWHADRDQPIKDNSAPFRFVTPRIYNLWLQIKDPSNGLHIFLVNQDTANGVKPRAEPSRGRCPPFTGKELVDFIMQHAKLRRREEAIKSAELLLGAYVIRVVSGSDDAFVETLTYAIIREYVTLQSFQGLITKKQWLSCQIGKSNWKNRFFALVPDHQRLYYFESEDAMKPIDSVELKRSIPRKVDESMFGRKFIFQLVTDGGSLFLECKTQDDCDQWVAALAGIATDSSAPAKGTSEGRQLRSFRLRIDECQDLPTAFQGGYYAVISLGDTKVARTQIKYQSKTGKPTFAEEFFFSELPGTVQVTKVILMTHGKMKQDTEVGTVSIDLTKLQSHAETSDWFTLVRPEDDKFKGDGKDRKIRLRYTLESELVLPIIRYDKLLSILTDNYDLANDTLTCAAAENDQALLTVVRIFECQGKAVDFITYLVNRELAATSERNLLFRINSLATKVLVLYLKLVCVSYMQDAFRPVIAGLLEGKYPNVDISQTATILPIVQELWDALQKTMQRFPPFLYKFFYEVRAAANKAFPPKENEAVSTGQIVVTSFLFLRLFCPAVVAPQLYNLVDANPDQRTTRILKVIARILQYLANFKTEIEGDVFTPDNARVVNAFLKDNQVNMRNYIDGVCSREKSSLRVYGRVALPVDLERELAHLYYFNVRFAKPLFAQMSKENRQPLSRILEEISAYYKKQWPQTSQQYTYVAPVLDAK